MREQDHEQARQDQPSDELDQLLNAGLAKYTAAEPRAGLEERVLASLRIEQARVAHRGWWGWGLAVAAATVVLVVAAAWRLESSHISKTAKGGATSGLPEPSIAKHVPVTPVDPPKTATPRASHEGNGMRPSGRGVVHRTIAHPIRPDAVVATSPRLDQFPSPKPLSEQERMLLDYVEQFPEEAALIAQAQAALEDRQELERYRRQLDQGEPQIREKVE